MPHLKQSRIRAALFAVALVATTPAVGFAQVVLTAGNLTYSQNFNNGYTAGALTWTDNSTITGWYLNRNATGTPASVTVQTVTTGTATGPYYLLAHSTEPTNFALGARVSDTEGSLPSVSGSGYYIGLRLLNSTGAAITEFSLSYAGVQFFHSTGANKNDITVAYRIEPANTAVSFNSTGWNTITDLTYTAGLSGASSAAALNFNTAANRTDFDAVSTPVTWAAGSELWVRFYINNVGGVDQGVGIDNIQLTAVSAIPEPSTYAALFGALALGVVVYRRRRRRA
jgi:hypothetical protein